MGSWKPAIIAWGMTGIIGVGLAVGLILSPPPVHKVVLRASPLATGLMTDARCAAVPDGASYSQVVSVYGWPVKVTKAQRDGYSLQETDGWELDYPITPSLRSHFVRFCGVIFTKPGGAVAHKWLDL